MEKQCRSCYNGMATQGIVDIMINDNDLISIAICTEQSRLCIVKRNNSLFFTVVAPASWNTEVNMFPLFEAIVSTFVAD